MSEKRGWGKTVLGWFVVDESHSSPDAAPSADSADALIAKYAQEAPAGAAPLPVKLEGPLPKVVDGKVDFVPVFESAGVDAAERERVTKAQDLLRALPSETPDNVKRQIVEASLKAFGVPMDQIIEAAVAELEALEAFIRAGQQETQDLLTQSNQRIADLEGEIARVKQVMQQSVEEQQVRTRTANDEKLRVQQVLEFFGQEAVAKVVKESPKLHEPTGT